MTTNIFNNRKPATMTLTHNDTMNCYEVQYTCGTSILRVILRKDGDDPNSAGANVLDARGTQKDIAFLLDYFRDHYTQVRKITNQVSNENELKAMWKAGFRYTSPGAMEPEDRLDGHLHYLKERLSIMMVWERAGFYLWNARTLQAGQKVYDSEEEAYKARLALGDEEADVTYVKHHG